VPLALGEYWFWCFEEKFAASDQSWWS